MSEGPGFTETPKIELKQAGSSTPSIESVESSLGKAITITIAKAEETVLDHVIVTFAKKGRLTCQDLLKSRSTFELLAKAENEGVNTTEPALLAISDEAGIARTIYLTPMPESHFRDFAVWVGNVTETLINLKARKVGIYLCNDTLDRESISELVSQVVRALVESSPVKNISLIVGKHAYNQILNTALLLKNELESGTSSIHILH